MSQLFSLVSKKLITVFALTTLFCSQARAVPYRGNNIYSSTDNQGRPIIILSGNSNTRWLIKYLSQEKQITLYINACGLIKINNRNHKIRRLKVGNTDINLSTLPVNSVPKCNREISQFFINNTSNFVTSDGVIYIANAGESFMPVNGEVQYLIERRIIPNMCGFAVFRAPFNKTRFPATFEWNGNTYQANNLVVALEPPRCVRDKLTGIFRTIIPSIYNQ
jgi:hypothetical protein